ncbi:hypothetical protein [Ectothiorhodospira lacustris]|uniref:hypothetical protein n=1 Tax=Ectothiorhodospira lacustris TaxID=2899127 RepID=UPI001EE89AA5|nr:hypothetical protein [Ectothiorhodospira lacustris]MCG5501450.1 hypothetical protein [Ectothiorhodospira lacustris]MCG5509892.1 hypothetical protein [Ectothiorhodospira lacustris]MCG5521145.1 hypothetical protein [Ectothiorhodospira lacustris]
MTNLMNNAATPFEAANDAIHALPWTDMALETVDTAVRMGEYGAARLRFLKLAQQSQIRVLLHISPKDAVRLAEGLPTYTVARLFEQLPRPLGRAIVQSLPEVKRQGVVVILNHRRRRSPRQQAMG